VAMFRKSQQELAVTTNSAPTFMARVQPTVVAARDRVVPAVAATRERVGPAMAATRERMTPAMEMARERLNEDVIPRLAAAIAVAAETMEQRAHEVHDRAYEVAMRPERMRRQKRRRVVMLGVLGAGLAAGAAVLFRRNRADNWDKFEAEAEDWATQARKSAGETGESATTGTTGAAGGTMGTGSAAGMDEFGGATSSDVGRETIGGDTAGAGPGEALSDSSVIPGEPTSPEEPLDEVSVPETSDRTPPRTSPKNDY
jgi:hypothetical protein